MVKIFLESGANIRAKDNRKWTSLTLGNLFQLFIHFETIYYFLFIASYKGHIAVVKLLVDRGADLESKDVDGFTPLMRGTFLSYLIKLFRIA